MEVTRHNLKDALKDVETHIVNADFYAIDLEMSGIDTSLFRSRGLTPQQTYKRMAEAASKYSMIQFGLSLFLKREGDDEGYDAKTYNFYTFQQLNTDIVMSSRAMEFLRENGMDFQKWVSEGITYCNAATEEKLRARYLDAQEPMVADKKKKYPPLKLTRVLDIEFVDNAVADFKWWLAEIQTKSDSGSPAEEKMEFAFKKCNAFLRKALHGAVDEILEVVSNGDACFEREVRAGQLHIIRLSTAAKEAHMAEKVAENEEKFSSAIGLRRLFKILAESKLALVGHNPMYDLLFIMDSFDAPLPDKLTAFKHRVHQLFPRVVDTKYLATYTTSAPLLYDGPVYHDTSLEALYKDLLQQDKIPLIDNAYHKESDGDGQYHQAGWDAYCTGACFAALAKTYVEHVGDDTHPETTWEDVVFHAGNRLNGTSSLLRWDLTTDTDTSDAEIRGGAVFHVAGITAADGGDKLAQLFDAPDILTSITWINDTSAFVHVVPKKEYGKPTAPLDTAACLAAAKRAGLQRGLEVTPWVQYCREIDTPTDAPVTSGWLGWLFGSGTKDSSSSSAEQGSSEQSRKRRRVE
eukprot:m.263850 g.263850  ORF g.263850 m.263850 type:complete len:577 (+) comp19710_c0_seq1:215-1945(+)